MNNVDSSEHNIYIYNRSNLEISGIIDVSGFSETIVEAEYSGGNIAIEGSELKIIDFSSQTGILKIMGTVNAVYYYGSSHKKRKGLFSK